jgi:hypothetical protein
MPVLAGPGVQHDMWWLPTHATPERLIFHASAEHQFGRLLASKAPVFRG